jgi:hypothetical protein
MDTDWYDNMKYKSKENWRIYVTQRHVAREEMIARGISYEIQDYIPKGLS